MFDRLKEIFKEPENDVHGDNSFRAVTKEDIRGSVEKGSIVYETDHNGLCTVWLKSLEGLDINKICSGIVHDTYEREYVLIKDWDFVEIGPTSSP